ncbi:DUF881 domain-containing protein [Clostridium paraputrificum]|uniref:DUF881 domain-containing protein n=1 Tax=Clostridium TaxID=1485 RepID=UPI003D33312C
MKKRTSQVSIAIICVLLGFLITYQFKTLSKGNTGYSSDIVSEVEGLRKEKDELTKSQTELMKELKELEGSATDETDIGQEIKKQLDSARMQLGLVSVKGKGIELTLTKKNSFFGGNVSGDAQNLGEVELVHLINLIWYAQAEAIEINEYRVTPQTGIKNSGKFITIGSAGKINPAEKIVIKIIGDVPKLKKALTFKMDIEYGGLKAYDFDIVEQNEIIINKSTESIKSDHIQGIN